MYYKPRHVALAFFMTKSDTSISFLHHCPHHSPWIHLLWITHPHHNAVTLINVVIIVSVTAVAILVAIITVNISLIASSY